MHDGGLHRFARLIETLDCSAEPEVNRTALLRYFAEADAEDAACALHLLRGGALRTGVSPRGLRQLACQVAGIDPWLFDACRQVTGDLSETIVHLLPPPTRVEHASGLAHWVRQRVLTLRGLPPSERDARITQAWAQLDTAGRHLFTQLVAGGLRVKPDARWLLQTLAAHAQRDVRLLAQRLEGWADARSLPGAALWLALVAPDDGVRAGLPFAFNRAAEHAGEPEVLGAPADWMAQWLLDGLHAQIVKRQGQVWIWSADEELVTAALPDVAALARGLPDGTVLDGVLKGGLSRRKGQPPYFVVQDLLEEQGADLRRLSLQDRLARLQVQPWLHAGVGLGVSPALPLSRWRAADDLRRSAREQGALGLLLRARHSVRDGSPSSQTSAWAWRSEPLRLAAVLVYVHIDASGRQPGECSFAVWSRPPADAGEVQAVLDAIARREAPRAGDLALVTVAKLIPGTVAADAMDLPQLIQATTVHRVGPIRVLRPTRVVELGFDAVHPSPRHRCGFVLQGARVLHGHLAPELHAAGQLEPLRALCSKVSKL